ncbi:MAG: class I SAM-dependent methyltransferase [Defluviitaleaceae bacterium]|nr:class I SAM-dependent methyltransferase [Defluviitaleaceae bacterium]
MESNKNKNLWRQTAWIYDIEHEKNQPLPDIPFYIEYAKQQCGEGGKILELGCGTGRVALSLAKEGFNIIGLDLSQDMLGIFREKLAKEVAKHPELTNRVKIIHDNMADFSLGQKFVLITAPFRAFQAVTAQDDIENTLNCAREHLTDDGIFILNVFNPYKNPLDESWCEFKLYSKLMEV